MSAAAAGRPGNDSEDAPAYAKGSLIARRYRVYRQVSGGIGDVYFCVDEKSGLPLAIKCLKEKYVNRPGKYASLRRRFNAEAPISAWNGTQTSSAATPHRRRRRRCGAGVDTDPNEEMSAWAA